MYICIVKFIFAYLEKPIAAYEEVDDYHEAFQLLPSNFEQYYPIYTYT